MPGLLQSCLDSRNNNAIRIKPLHAHFMSMLHSLDTVCLFLQVFVCPLTM